MSSCNQRKNNSELEMMDGEIFFQFYIPRLRKSKNKNFKKQKAAFK